MRSSSHRPELQTPPEDMRRLRWRSRRGLLENDLLIGRFLDQYGQGLNASDADALARLLELPDTELLELLLGHRQPGAELDSPTIRDVLTRLRSVRLEPVASRPPTPAAPRTLPCTSGA
jgi:antitoxin CptB